MIFTPASFYYVSTFLKYLRKYFQYRKSLHRNVISLHSSNNLTFVISILHDNGNGSRCYLAIECIYKKKILY